MKLSPWIILVIGITIGLSALVFAFVHQFLPNMEEKGYYDRHIEALNREIAKRPKAEERVRKAQEMVAEVGAEWQRIVEERTPPIGLENGGINLSVNGWQLTVDSLRFRNRIQRDLNAQARKGGVRNVIVPTVPFPGENATTILDEYYNLRAFGFPAMVIDVGTIQVQGTLKQIMRNVEAWADMPNYLASTSNLQISGTSPILTATYRVQLAVFIRSRDIFPPVPEGTTIPAGGGGAPPGFGAPRAGGGVPAPGVPAAGGPGGGRPQELID